MSEHVITKESIRDALEKLGISRGDCVVMHSNLQSLARPRCLARLPNCGADALIDAFLDLLGPEGILCVPTFTKTFANPISGPYGEIFDPDTTPSRVGSITNAVLKRKQRARSLHPTHSWAAIGRDAAAFVEGHERASTFGRNSVCGRMYDWDSKIVWFGTTGTTNTSTHFAEDWLDLPNMTSETALVKDGGGFRKVTVYRCPSGPRDFYKDGCKLDGLMAKWGIQTTGKAHEATVAVMRHRVFMNHLLRAMIEDPCLLLADGEDDAYHLQFYRINVEHMNRHRARLGGPDGILKSLCCALP
ncbi:MAG: AAC(3) family N-acetyltransferase [Verrucomicrobiota bacterium]|nr:AAC(3) family N-acetyltransferase [Verrucomicrobiota bacterium]